MIKSIKITDTLCAIRTNCAFFAVINLRNTKSTSIVINIGDFIVNYTC